MFRLIQLYPVDNHTLIDVESDGYANATAAWAGLRAASVPYFGVGRFDPAACLVDVTIDPFCTAAGRSGLCCGAVTVVDTERYHPMCIECGAWHDVISLRELGRRLGAPVTTVRPTTAQRPAPGGDPTNPLSHRIARELACHIIDPAWRSRICAELAETPRAVNGLLIGVGALSNRQVLDLYPALLSLAAMLPPELWADLELAAGKPRSPAGMAALRLGFPGLRQP